MSLYKNCVLCPRKCGIDREAENSGAERRGYCRETSALRIAFAGIHRGEEPPITGEGGSGTIFISGCNLGCVFCQNYQLFKGKLISSEKQLSKGKQPSQGLGRIVSTGEFAEICLALQERGAENINIVTGSHAAPAIALGIGEVRKQGLSIPVLWNSSGYEGAETLEILKDFVDVYLPDLKTLDSKISARYFNAPDYPEHAVKAILKMIEYQKLRFGPGRGGPAFAPVAAGKYAGAEILVSGVMIRHLLIPGYLEATRQALRWFSENCKGRALLSLMTQYTPIQNVGAGIPNRYVSEQEYKAVISMLNDFGIDDGYCQELVTGSDWLPDFNRSNPFSTDLSIPVWHHDSRYAPM